MADFNAAFEKTSAIEGGYVFDPDDAGGETYKGISRRFNPSWEGWARIDAIKQAHPGKRKPDRLFVQDEALQEEVVSFYRRAYWDRFRGDEVPVQKIAEELFDTGVNMGVRRAVRFLQEGLNLLNRNRKDYTDIMEDGLFGKNTLKTLKVYLHKNDAAYLLKIMNILQGMHYIETMRKNPAQEKYARGWLKRVEV